MFILVENILRPEIKKEFGTQKKATQKDVIKTRPFACFCEPCLNGNEEECVNKIWIGNATWTEQLIDKIENRKRKSDNCSVKQREKSRSSQKTCDRMSQNKFSAINSCHASHQLRLADKPEVRQDKLLTNDRVTFKVQKRR